MVKKIVGAAKYLFFGSVVLLLATELIAAAREIRIVPTCQKRNCYECGVGYLPIKDADLKAMAPFVCLNTESSAPAYETAISPDNKLTVVYPASVFQAEEFKNKVTIKGYGRMYSYFIDGEKVETVWPVIDKNKTFVHSHVFGEPQTHNFRVELLYCKDPELAECGHNRLTTSVSWQVKIEAEAAKPR